MSTQESRIITERSENEKQPFEINLSHTLILCSTLDIIKMLTRRANHSEEMIGWIR